MSEGGFNVAKFNAIFSKELSKLGFGARMPRWSYFRHDLKALEPRHRGQTRRQRKKDGFVFAYTTEPLVEQGKKRYYALKYRVKRLKVSREEWTLIKKRGFARRKVAKAKAVEWYNKRGEELRARGLKL